MKQSLYCSSSSLFAVAVALGVVLTAPQAHAQAKPKITIGAVLPLTGVLDNPFLQMLEAGRFSHVAAST